MKTDPIEQSAEYKAVIIEVEKRARANLTHTGKGSCFEFWLLKKRYLKEYGIEWKSPKELNPKIKFD